MATSRLVTRTVYGAYLQTVRQLGLKLEVPEYTTINQALNEPSIMANLPTPQTAGMEVYDPYSYETDTQNVYTRYVVLGNGGHRNVNNPGDAVPYSDPIPHLATDTAPYNLMPLVVRPLTNALTAAERKRYRLRRTFQRNGVMYEAYFGLVIDYSRTTPDMYTTDVVNGVEQKNLFVPTINNLNPTQPEDTVNYTGRYASVSALVSLVFSAQDIQNLKDACNIMFGNERAAIISEIAICSGVEKPVKSYYPATGAQVVVNVPANTFFEAAACQVVLFITTYIPLAAVDQQYTLNLDIGATEPLFGVQASS